ncbi:beta-lactamase family protein, partial [Verrucomicrobia bacterium]|nr:beta-lactamase family protein [Verrucomicrobiota bacterium]
ITLEENIKRLASVPLAHEPGEKFTYGMNMDVLGRVIEVLDGRPFAKYMREEIFDVLDMDDTGFSVKKKKQDRVVTVYTTVDDDLAVYDDEVIAELAPNNYREWWKQDSDAIAMGGGGIISSAYDYARFLQMLLNGGELGGERILGRKTVELLSRGLYQSDPEASTAMGLSVSVVTDASKHYHPESEGAYNWGGYFYTSFWVDPKEGFIGVLMSQVNPTKSRMGGQFKIMAYSALE